MAHFEGTTILAVRRENEVAMAGDGQVSLSGTIIKAGAKKVRRLYQDKVLAGFAGSTADAFTLFERFEAKLEAYRGNLMRASVELAKDWRTDRILRRLEAMLLVADREHILLLTGGGDVLAPDEPAMAIGCGGEYARAAALALSLHTGLKAAEIAKVALEIAGKICVYTNDTLTIEVLEG